MVRLCLWALRAVFEGLALALQLPKCSGVPTLLGGVKCLQAMVGMIAFCCMPHVQLPAQAVLHEPGAFVRYVLCFPMVLWQVGDIQQLQAVSYRCKTEDVCSIFLLFCDTAVAPSGSGVCSEAREELCERRLTHNGLLL